MVLVDTSVWVDHLRQGDKVLVDLLMLGQVCMHPMIIGELACGNLHKRDQLIALWQGLPSITEASHSEALYCLAKNDLSGKGIGFVDLHLITATLLTPSTLIWTRDRRLKAAAQTLNISSLAD
ncbi:MAG: putative nucleic acid-binding protein [Zhongshania aliphaticivorans]|jgi:predicted nucleic acid-binding protein